MLYEPKQEYTLLIIEDNRTTALILQSYLVPEYRVLAAASAIEGLSKLHNEHCDLILLDLSLPDKDGIELLKEIREIDTEVPIIIVTSERSKVRVAEALSAAANDYLEKPVDRTRLRVSIQAALREYSLRQRLDELNASVDDDALWNIIGRSPKIREVFHTIRRAANSRASIFITGESGTGKELCAEAIHLESQRRTQPFVAINCAAIPRELLESELFGHIKGSFTGADRTRQGAAAKANGGTLFLDEIGELPFELQSKLLRFIQTQQFSPLGSNEVHKVDIRFICATNRDPQQAINEGILREDLFYRLNVISIYMPPLRERGSDISLIANRLLKKIATEEHKNFKSFSQTAEAIMRGYAWPGNIRELNNVIRKIVVLNDGEVVTPPMLPRELLVHEAPAPTQSKSVTSYPLLPLQPLWLSEKQIIEFTLEQCQGNIKEAAIILEVNASTLYRKLKKWHINVDSIRRENDDVQ